MIFEREWLWCGKAAEMGEWALVLAVVVLVLVLGGYAYPSKASPLAFPCPCSEYASTPELPPAPNRLLSRLPLILLTRYLGYSIVTFVMAFVSEFERERTRPINEVSFSLVRPRPR